MEISWLTRSNLKSTSQRWHYKYTATSIEIKEAQEVINDPYAKEKTISWNEFCADVKKQEKKSEEMFKKMQASSPGAQVQQGSAARIEVIVPKNLELPPYAVDENGKTVPTVNME